MKDILIIRNFSKWNSFIKFIKLFIYTRSYWDSILYKVSLVEKLLGVNQVIKNCCLKFFNTKHLNRARVFSSSWNWWRRPSCLSATKRGVGKNSVAQGSGAQCSTECSRHREKFGERKRRGWNCVYANWEGIGGGGVAAVIDSNDIFTPKATARV